MVEYRDRLISAMKDASVSVQQLADSMKVSYQAVKKVVDGKSNSFSARNNSKAATHLNVNPNWLATGNGNKEVLSPHSAASQFPITHNDSLQTIAIGGRVPVISFIAAGNWRVAMDNYQVGESDEWVNTTVSVKKHTYALRVDGDSMEPKFPHGSIIIIEPDEEARNGSYVIVRQNGSDATFKQLVIDGGQRYLKPLNDRYPIMSMQENSVMCGVVKQMVMDV